jgi:hypothetical protein
VNLAGEIDVGVKTPLPPQQPDVLEALDGLPDAELAHQEAAGTRSVMVAGAYHKFILRPPRAPLLEWLVLVSLRS